jgi:hypothetical protein
MLLRTFLIFLLIQSYSSTALSQQDEISVLLNNKIIGKTFIKEDSLNVITIKKSDSKESTLTIILNLNAPNKVYKRNIELTDGNEIELSNINESTSDPGTYKVDLTGTGEKILEQQVIKIFLEENPVNEKMAIPSRRKLLAELHLK